MGPAKGQRVGSRRLTPVPVVRPIADGTRVVGRAQCSRDVDLSFESLRNTAVEKHFCTAKG